MSSLYQNVRFDPSNMSAFGSLEAVDMTPVVQLDFVYGINTQTGTSTVANSATIDTSNSRLRLQSGTNSAGSATFVSRKIARYRAGQWMTARFTTVFATSAASSTQIVGVGSSTDGLFYGYNGTSFGILHRNNSVDTWVAQTAWNQDKCDGTGASAFTWDKTKGNVCMVKYPYLGYGDIEFFVQNPATGRWILAHVIQYSNSSAEVEYRNPNFQFYAQALNSGNTTNLTVYCASVGIFISGSRSFSSAARYATDNSKATVTTETNLLSIRNATTYNGVTNRWLVRLNSVSVSNTANSTVFLRLKLGSTLGGTPAFAAVNGATADNGVTITSGNSVASVDVAGTTVTGGTQVFGLNVGPSGSYTFDLTDLDLFVAPGETITISGSSSANATIATSVNWFEDV